MKKKKKKKAVVQQLVQVVRAINGQKVVTKKLKCNHRASITCCTLIRCND